MKFTVQNQEFDCSNRDQYRWFLPVYFKTLGSKNSLCDLLVYDNLLKLWGLTPAFQRKYTVPIQGLRRSGQYIFLKLWHPITRLHDIIIQNTTVKVKIILEQTTKSQRGSRGITLLFLQPRS